MPLPQSREDFKFVLLEAHVVGDIPPLSAEVVGLGVAAAAVVWS